MGASDGEQGRSDQFSGGDRRTGPAREARGALGAGRNAWRLVSLKVAEPPAAELADAAVRRLLDETKAQAVRQRQGAIDWVGAEDAADVRLRAYGGRLWILPADAEWVREDSRRDVPKLKAYPLTPSYPVTSAASVGNVADALHKIARARNMVRLAEVADPTRSGSNPWNGLKVSAERVPAPGDDKNPQRACRDLHRISNERDLP